MYHSQSITKIGSSIKSKTPIGNRIRKSTQVKVMIKINPRALINCNEEIAELYYKTLKKGLVKRITLLSMTVM